MRPPLRRLPSAVLILFAACARRAPAEDPLARLVAEHAADAAAPALEVLSAEDAERRARGARGTLSGVGVRVSTRGDWPEILETVPGSPAARAGLAPGERIAALDGKSAFGLDLDAVARALQGAPGSAVEVQVGGAGGVRSVRLTREAVDLPAVELSPLEPGFWELKIRAFHAGTAAAALSALRGLPERGVRGVVLDLRGNRGGAVPAAVETARLFLGGEAPIFTTSARRAEYRTTAHAAPRAGWSDSVPLAVRVDAATAAAAEILAAALRDNGRARVFGAPTAGSGGIRRAFVLPQGRVARLTVAFVLTPAGSAIEGAGLRPEKPGEGPVFGLFSKN